MKLTKEKLLHLIREELAENVTSDVSVMVDSILDSGDLDRALENAKRSFYEMADQGAFGEFLDAYEVLKGIK
jgi:hypothetical protein